MGKKFAQTEILKKFNDKHGFKFDYSKFKYRKIKSNSMIRCIKHNKWRKISAHDHLRYETGGCKVCESEYLSERQRLSLSEFACFRVV